MRDGVMVIGEEVASFESTIQPFEKGKARRGHFIDNHAANMRVLLLVALLVAVASADNVVVLESSNFDEVRTSDPLVNR